MFLIVVFFFTFFAGHWPTCALEAKHAAKSTSHRNQHSSNKLHLKWALWHPNLRRNAEVYQEGRGMDPQLLQAARVDGRCFYRSTTQKTQNAYCDLFSFTSSIKWALFRILTPLQVSLFRKKRKLFKTNQIPSMPNAPESIRKRVHVFSKKQTGGSIQSLQNPTWPHRLVQKNMGIWFV